MSSEGRETGESIVLDREQALAAMAGDVELLSEMAEIFLSDLPSMVEKVERAVSEGDSGALHRSAHTLKGAVNNFRAQPAAAAAFRLECIGREGDLTDAEAARERLLQELGRLTPEIEKLVQG
jgi:HPt (histidine-containing phosphotransfer) domain-containing protein